MRLFNRMSAFVLVGLPVSACLVAACGKGESPPAPAPPPQGSTPSPTTAAVDPAVAPEAKPAIAPPVDEVKPAPTEPAEPAAEAPTECEHHHVVVGTRTGEKFPGAADLRGVILHVDGFMAETEAKAIERLDYNGVKATAETAVLGYVDADQDYRVYVKLNAEAGGEFVLFSKFASLGSESIETASAVIGDGRFAVLTTVQNYYERVPFCANGEENEDDCATASADAGDDTLYSVFDRKTGAHLFNAVDSRGQEVKCKAEDRAPTFADGKFSFTSCDGTVDSFALSELPPCTAKALEEYLTMEREADENTAKILAAEGGGPGSLTSQERKELVNKGRKLTKMKDYAGAIEAFTEVVKDDRAAVTALSGRGYALMMRSTGDDLAAADADFLAALETITGESPAENKLRSQIIFNRATVAKKRGDDAAAEALFSLAKEFKGE